MIALKEGHGSFADALIGAINAQAGCSRTFTFDRKALRLPHRHVESSIRRACFQLAQCANRTVMCCPEGRWLPGAGHCSRATPLPMALISNPDCCAISTAERSGLPRNDGTTTPLSTSRTTVPFAADCPAGLAARRRRRLRDFGSRRRLRCFVLGAVAAVVGTGEFAYRLGRLDVPASPALAVASRAASSCNGAPRWSGDSSVKSSSFADASRVCRCGLFTSRSCGTCRYSSTCCAIRLNTGAETCPP